jgi:protein-L-isoaspartate(D-aspartate) O-methyltransferase
MNTHAIESWCACLAGALVVNCVACDPRATRSERVQPLEAVQPSDSQDSDPFASARHAMVHDQLAARGIEDERVLNAMADVPRHQFVDPAYTQRAYEDTALPIAADQTISQPYIVALMTELADVQPGDKVLEVGTGSGYQAAVLAAMGARVFSIEIVDELAAQAKERLKRLDYDVEVRAGDGYAGWLEEAPFDAILITASPPQVPDPLPAQLARGGKLVTPVGEGSQELWVWTKSNGGYDKRSVTPVKFVPMTGAAQQAN